MKEPQSGKKVLQQCKVRGKAFAGSLVHYKVVNCISLLFANLDADSDIICDNDTKLLATDNPDIKGAAEEIDNWTPLHVVAENGLTELVAAFSEENVMNNVTTPLHVAAKNGHVEVARLLARKFGSHIDAKNAVGKTPLHMSAENGHVEIMEMLIREFNADVAVKDVLNRTPLDLLKVFRDQN